MKIKLNFIPKVSKMKQITLILLCSIFSFGLQAQVFEFTDQEANTHRIILTDNYLVETIFQSNPATFVLTRGGFVEKKGKFFNVKLEFNSNFEMDEKKDLALKMSKDWKKVSLADQEMENNWLFSGRVVNGKESTRRGEDSSRKTLKILFDGYFLWIAYDVADMKFSGSGGGLYTARNGKYIETIQYFSKDNSRVGAVLSFDYELINNEWHHTGLSSKGDPIHEIWAKR
ncbi:hypothetical protein SAMN06298216_0370 [Spirosomataceae bacterium TFI 002]|nr:hypothetical protein SAMN06298216_0370 [Spirosomataceae bacterium TFI 002]